MPDCLLNALSPAEGSKRKRLRVGRGRGAGRGKTCGRGHKGQKSRSGGNVRRGFEGGQMPLQRRLPKAGFRSRANNAEVTLSEVNSLSCETINREILTREGVVSRLAKNIKVIDSGTINRVVVVVGIKASRGARKRIEEAGGVVRTGAS